MQKSVGQFNDIFLKSLPLAETGQYIVREESTPGFFVVVGKTSKAFTAQVPVKIKMRWTSRRKKIASVGDVSIREARRQARKLMIEAPQDVKESELRQNSPEAVTLNTAWVSYQRRLTKKVRSPRTIEYYEENLERYLQDWLPIPLLELAEMAESRDIFEKRHNKITRENGKYAANAALRSFRAIFNHAARKDRALKGRNPVDAIDFNREERRQSALDYDELARWYDQLWKLDNPVRREFHLLSLLTGSRPTALKTSRWEDLHIKEKRWHFPKPKGGSSRAFDIPLTRPILASLIRARRAAERLNLDSRGEFIFPARSETGHLEEIKEDRQVLSRYGNDLRQSFRTFGVAVGIGEVQLKMLMNHSMKGVAQGYTNLKPLWPLLCANQISIFQHIRENVHNFDRRSVNGPKHDLH